MTEHILTALPGQIVPGARELWLPVPCDDHCYIGRGADGLYRYSRDGSLNLGKITCPYHVGAVLAFREEWYFSHFDDADNSITVSYRGGHWETKFLSYDHVEMLSAFVQCDGLRPAETMPAWAIRHRFTVGSVRVGQLSEATIRDGRDAGFDGTGDFPRYQLRQHLTSLHGEREFYFVCGRADG